MVTVWALFFMKRKLFLFSFKWEAAQPSRFDAGALVPGLLAAVIEALGFREGVHELLLQGLELRVVLFDLDVKGVLHESIAVGLWQLCALDGHADRAHGDALIGQESPPVEVRDLHLQRSGVRHVLEHLGALPKGDVDMDALHGLLLEDGAVLGARGVRRAERRVRRVGGLLVGQFLNVLGERLDAGDGIHQHRPLGPLVRLPHARARHGRPLAAVDRVKRVPQRRRLLVLVGTGFPSALWHDVS
mmetsp:Transcript_10035/g.25792  ORF Transcript_10035/g.25792 Transcript_10035/m.25792 type:complete len:245 (+) Transcript_10035:31-765(+)